MSIVSLPVHSHVAVGNVFFSMSEWYLLTILFMKSDAKGPSPAAPLLGIPRPVLPLSHKRYCTRHGPFGFVIMWRDNGVIIDSFGGIRSLQSMIRSSAAERRILYVSRYNCRARSILLTLFRHSVTIHSFVTDVIFRSLASSSFDSRSASFPRSNAISSIVKNK